MEKKIKLIELIHQEKLAGAKLIDLATKYNISTSLISKQLRAYCQENGLEYKKNKKGRKIINLSAIDIAVKTFEEAETQSEGLKQMFEEMELKDLQD